MGKIEAIRGPRTNESYEYDSYGRKIRTYNGKGYTNYQYDVLDRIIGVTNADGTSSSTIYNDIENLKEVTNEEGHRHSYYYDSIGNIIREVAPNGNSSINNYNSRGQLISTINANGFLTNYEYNYLGNVIKVIDTAEKTFIYQYDSKNLNFITNVYTTNGLISSKTYDEKGRILSETGIGNYRRDFEHDEAGNIIKETNTLSNSDICYNYDSRNRLFSKNSGSMSYNYTYDNVGNIKTITSNSGTINYEYNNDNTIRKITLPDGKSISYGYDSYGNRISANDYYEKLITYEYDIMNRLTRVVCDDGQYISYNYYPDGMLKNLTTGNGNLIVTEAAYTYDSNNNLIDLTNDYETSKSYKYTYDAMGNQISKIDYLGCTTYTYDSYNRVKTVLNPDGNTISYEYDEYGNITREVMNTSNSSVIATSSYVYDEFNRLDHVIKEEPLKLKSLSISPAEMYVLPDKNITFELNGYLVNGVAIPDELLNQAVWTTDSPVLTLNASKGKTVTGVVSQADWGALPEVKAITVKAMIQNMFVEAKVYKNRIIELNITPSTVFTLPNQEIAFTLTGIMDDGSFATYQWLNKAIWTCDKPYITLNTVPVNSEQEGVQSIDVTGVISSENWNSMNPGTYITVSADIYGKIVSAKIYRGTVGTPTLTYLSITPNSAGYKKGWSGTFTLSGLMTDGTEANDSLLNTAVWNVGKQFSISSNTGKTVTVTYIGDGTPSTGNDLLTESSAVEKIIPIIPDIPEINEDLVATIGDISTVADLIQIAIEIPDDPPGPGIPPIKPPVDPYEIQYKIPVGNNAVNEIESDNQITSTPSDKTMIYFSYDNRGNMIEKIIVKADSEEVSTYRYDDFNQLTEVINPQGVTTFTYYPSGLRDTKTHNGRLTKYYYDGQNVIIEEVNGDINARNIFGIGAGIAIRETIDASGNKNNYYYIYNGHGDVTALIDENRNVVNEYEYDIYGDPLKPETTIDNPFRYAGQYYDKETGFYYLRARYYDPELMRFITEDTNRGDVKDPLSLNLYTYCYGNPIKYYDPSGNTGELAAGWFGSMWWLVGVDGPVPIGDAIYVIGGGLVYVGEALVTYGSQLVAAADKVKDKIGDNSSSGNQDPNNKNRNNNPVVRSIEDIINDVNKRTGQGNCGIGSATQRQAEQAGLKWLGNGYKAIYSNNKFVGYVSKDGLRVYRVMFKEGRQVYEANFVQYIIDEFGNKIIDFNAHLSIIK